MEMGASQIGGQTRAARPDFDNNGLQIDDDLGVNATTGMQLFRENKNHMHADILFFIMVKGRIDCIGHFAQVRQERTTE